MKAIICKTWGDPSSLVIEEVQRPTLLEGDTRVAVQAVGLNPADTYVIAGRFQLPPALPFTPGFEAAGEVIESRMSDIKPGTRVLVTLPFWRGDRPNFGAFAEEVVVPAANAIAIPNSMDFITAASIPVVYGTAYIALTHRAQLKTGEVLLVTGGSGGTGSAAIQIGKRLGATVIATTSSSEKANYLINLGADVVINYTTENVAERVLSFTSGKGADVVFETVGGDLFDAALQCIAFEGRILPIGVASGRIPEISILQVLIKNFALVGIDFANYTLNNIHLVRQALQEVLDWYTKDLIKPTAPKTVPLEQAAEALTRVASGQAGGKVVLTVQ